MSKITAKDVRKVAQLARLDLPDDQIATYTDQLEKILAYVAQLEEIDTVNPKLEEDHDIKKRYIRMNNFKNIIQTYESASNEISESDQSLVHKLNLIYQKSNILKNDIRKEFDDKIRHFQKFFNCLV